MFTLELKTSYNMNILYILIINKQENDIHFYPSNGLRCKGTLVNWF